MSAPFVTPSICQGGEEQHDLHVRYCVPLAEQLDGTRTLTEDQAHDLLDQAVGLFLEFRDQHGQDEEQARISAVWEVLDGLFTDLPDDAARREAWDREQCVACEHAQGAHGPSTGCHVAPCPCIGFVSDEDGVR